jgi:prefoldin subunit 5
MKKTVENLKKEIVELKSRRDDLNKSLKMLTQAKES